MIKGFMPGLPEVGKIKIGKKGLLKTSSSGKKFRMPEKSDHFTVTSLERDQNDDFKPNNKIMKMLGENPTIIPIRLLYNNIDLNFPTSYAMYSKSKCECRGDGEFIDSQYIQNELKCDPKTCEHFKSKKCKPNGILSVTIDGSALIGGVYKFRTTGFNSIKNILSSMSYIQTLTGGVLAGLPLQMRLIPKTVSPNGMTGTTTVYTVNIEFAGTANELIEHAKEIAITQGAMRNEILAIEERATEALQQPESKQECKDVSDEFYPIDLDKKPDIGIPDKKPEISIPNKKPSLHQEPIDGCELTEIIEVDHEIKDKIRAKHMDTKNDIQFWNMPYREDMVNVEINKFGLVGCCNCEEWQTEGKCEHLTILKRMIVDNNRDNIEVLGM